MYFNVVIWETSVRKLLDIFSLWMILIMTQKTMIFVGEFLVGIGSCTSMKKDPLLFIEVFQRNKDRFVEL